MLKSIRSPLLALAFVVGLAGAAVATPGVRFGPGVRSCRSPGDQHQGLLPGSTQTGKMTILVCQLTCVCISLFRRSAA